MRFEVWGSSFGAAYLALRLHKLGADVTWRRLREDSSQKQLRPARIGPESRSLFRELQSSYTRPYYLWKDSAGPKAWSFEDDLPYKPISLSIFGNVESWISPATLLKELNDISELSRIPIQEVDAAEFDVKFFEQGRCVRIVDFRPELIEAHRGRYFPEKLARVVFQERSWELGLTDATRHAQTIAFHPFEGGARGILELSAENRAYLTLIAPNSYSMERAELAVSEPRGSAPMRWKALFLQTEKLQYFERQRPQGISRMEIPGVYQMGEAIGGTNSWANLELDSQIAQAERLFRKLYRLSQLKNHTLDAQEWNRAESSRFRKSDLRSRRAERLIYSKALRMWVSSASMFLPTNLRSYLNLPV